MDWIYRTRVDDWSAMTTLPKQLRQELAATFRFPSITLEELRESADGTQKYLWKLVDGEAVESVMIPSARRDTFCVSSQADARSRARSARPDCSVQAQPHGGRDRRPGATLQRSREDAGHGANVVFMGMGEPLLNWENLRIALLLLVDERYLDVARAGSRFRPSACPTGSSRSARVSAGSAGGLAACGDRRVAGPHRAHQPRYPLRQLFAACRLWCEATGKRMTFEYLHLPGVNDRPEDVAALGRVVEGLSVQVNLMRYNPIPGADFRRPSVHETERFRDALRRETGAAVTIRRSRGLDIEGACGQLRLARGGSVVTAGERDA